MAKRESTQHKLDRVRKPPRSDHLRRRSERRDAAQGAAVCHGSAGRFFRQPRTSRCRRSKSASSWKSTGNNFDKSSRRHDAATGSARRRQAVRQGGQPNQHRAASASWKISSRKTSSSKLRPCGSCWKRATSSRTWSTRWRATTSSRASWRTSSKTPNRVKKWPSLGLDGSTSSATNEE